MEGLQQCAGAGGMRAGHRRTADDVVGIVTIAAKALAVGSPDVASRCVHFGNNQVGQEAAIRPTGAEGGQDVGKRVVDCAERHR